MAKILQKLPGSVNRFSLSELFFLTDGYDLYLILSLITFATYFRNINQGGSETQVQNFVKLKVVSYLAYQNSMIKMGFTVPLLKYSY